MVEKPLFELVLKGMVADASVDEEETDQARDGGPANPLLL